MSCEELGFLKKIVQELELAEMNRYMLGGEDMYVDGM